MSLDPFSNPFSMGASTSDIFKRYRGGGGRVPRRPVDAVAAEPDLLSDDTVFKVVDHMADRLIKSHILQNVTFGYDKSFLRPGKAPQLKAMCDEITAWKAEHPDGKIAVFGHADGAGEDAYNKTLSERRANSVHAFLMKDPAVWEGLYKAFMDQADTLALVAKDFDSIEGKATAGCSEFNQVEKNDGACEAGDDEPGTEAIEAAPAPAEEGGSNPSRCTGKGWPGSGSTCIKSFSGSSLSTRREP